MPKKTKAAGYATYKIVLVALAIVAVAAIVVIGLTRNHAERLPMGVSSEREPQVAEADCAGFTFSNDTIAFDQIEAVTPPGSIIGGSLKAHSYINFKPDKVDIVAPTGMTLVAASKYTEPTSSGKVQYLLDFEADCGLSIRYDHISHPNSEIADQLAGQPADSTHTQRLDPIDYTAGAVVGSTDGNGVQRQFDFGVYKIGHSNAFAEDSRYEPFIESSIHTTAVCPYDQYTDDRAKQYYQLFIFTDEHPQPDILCNQYD